MAIKPAPAKRPLAIPSAEDWISGKEVASSTVDVNVETPNDVKRAGEGTQTSAPASRPAGKTAPLMVRLDDSVLADMDRVALNMGVNRQALVKIAVTKYLRELLKTQ